MSEARQAGLAAIAIPAYWVTRIGLALIERQFGRDPQFFGMHLELLLIGPPICFVGAYFLQKAFSRNSHRLIGVISVGCGVGVAMTVAG